MTTPVIAVIQWVGYGVALHDHLKLSLVPICIGVIMATVNDLELTCQSAFCLPFWLVGCVRPSARESGADMCARRVRSVVMLLVLCARRDRSILWCARPYLHVLLPDLGQSQAGYTDASHATLSHSAVPAPSQVLTCRCLCCVRTRTCADALKLNSYQLLYYQAPLSSIVVLLTVPLFDQVNGPTGYAPTHTASRSPAQTRAFRGRLCSSVLRLCG
jgi:hypothetical protein